MLVVNVVKIQTGFFFSFSFFSPTCYKSYGFLGYGCCLANKNEVNMRASKQAKKKKKRHEADAVKVQSRRRKQKKRGINKYA